MGGMVVVGVGGGGKNQLIRKTEGSFIQARMGPYNVDGGNTLVIIDRGVRS